MKGCTTTRIYALLGHTQLKLLCKVTCVHTGAQWLGVVLKTTMGTLLYTIATSLSYVANSLNEHMLIICTLLSRTRREDKENNKRHLNVMP